MSDVYHATILNLHQPAGNLLELWHEKSWEAHEILYALDRIPRSLWEHEDVARIHLSLSGTLLETLSDPEFQQSAYGVVDCGSLLWYFQNLSIFKILGTAYYHPVLPLIPETDRHHHLERWQGIARHLFNRNQFQGFWPPEMAFSMELIPLVKRMGYRYVVVDSEHVEAVTPMSWQTLRYQPHVARYEGEEIVVVVRDRELSNAQESGMDRDWFESEVRERTKWCESAPLVITATDGDNGGWFRNPDEQANFWGFYKELLRQAKSGLTRIKPCFIDDYLDRFGTFGEVHIKTGAWNTGWHHGRNFTQWTGSQAQNDVLNRICLTSKELETTERQLQNRQDSEFSAHLEEARWHLLRAETSCNIYWGESWVPRAHADLEACWSELNHMKCRL
ncbi:MAG: glycoside hydrolase family 57 [Candidatus Thiodiazotropha sp. (ex Ctena orbiculata)]|nr:glycoside hydrolase family 57 [Candidatus Thiodiazotropha taylori]